MDKNIIKDELLTFLKKGNPLIAKIVKEKKFPYDTSLVELGLMDSFGVIEVITYLEKKYKISINDDEITKEKFGSFNKMAKLTLSKIKSK
jgi:acyl carrier protein